MYRFLLTPRWWALNVFLVLSVPFCLFMGSWQLSRFEDRVDSHQENERLAERAARQEPEPLDSLLPVDRETSGRMAAAHGRFDTGHQFLVPDRTLDDERGFYVLGLLHTAGDDGRVLPVVRGWLPGDPDPARVPAPPSGQVRVTGALQASESGGPVGLPEGQLGAISAASLINVVPHRVYDAWITVQDAEGPLTPVPPAAARGSGLDMKAFQNLGYTAEWFVFAGFAVFMWFRFLRREVEVARDAALGLPPDDAGPAAVRHPAAPEAAAPEREAPEPAAPEAAAPERAGGGVTAAAVPGPGDAGRTPAPERPA
ncbi:SURF1 family protein [Streptomyces sp. TRM 70351]|uniref:SURF1 family protein n=1 Tax=Streptomyces sp. TRM 70351 TaxID=3116552 RepID=UPI002E7ACDD4|nr:SURF1 family protein [Streptomyces sp. TRM 70351]MEE1930223.1 SURF1 family protein [Streptomyces sp. TRM 70351]